MTELKNNKGLNNNIPNFPVDLVEAQKAAKKTAKRVIAKVLTYVPAVIIFGLIALYYIQLSHMGA